MSQAKHTPQAVPVSLSGDIEYADNAIVSKTVIKKETGTITLFAFDEGQALSEHTTPYDALVHVVDGEAEIIIGGVAHTVGAGMYIVMPAGIPHAVNAAKAFKMLLVMIRS